MKCAVYVRVSTNRDEQKDSLVNQEKFFLDYISKNGYNFYATYSDVASGTSTRNRKSFLQLIEDVKNKKVDLVLTKEISRLGRSVIDTMKFYELCKDNDVHLIAFNNNINTLNNEVQYITLYSALAQMESENVSSRIKMALRTIASDGKFKGSIAPYAYYIDNKTLKIRNDYTADIVRRIFQEYISGKGLDTIARHLTRDGIPTPAKIANKKNAGAFWSGRTVQLILQNRNYTGDLTQCKTYVSSIRTKKRKNVNPEDFVIVENTHEAIISKEDFELVQELLVKRSRKQNNHRKSTHLFSNLLFCADCKRGMHFKKNRKGYICGNFDKNGKYGGCTSHIIREQELESIILKDIEIILKDIKVTYIDKINSKFEKEKLSLEKNINIYRNKIESLKEIKNNALKKLCSNIITDIEYKSITGEIDIEISNINSNIETLGKNLDKLNCLTKDDFIKLANELSSIKKLNKDILNRLIKRIEIKENGDVKIFYRFSYLHSTYQ